MAKKTATNEFIVAYRTNFEDYNAILKSSCKHWNATAKNQLKRKIQTLEDVWENSNKKIRNFEISFQNGSKAYFLYIPKTISVYELHTELRESFIEGIKEHDKLSFNVLNVSKEKQKILVNALTSLVKLAEWKFPTYGKKSKRTSKTKKDFGFYANIDTTESIDDGLAIADGTNLARTLCTTPTNFMTSAHLVEEARKVSRKLRGVKFQFINENKLKQLKAGCFLSVIQGTKGSDGGIVHLSYRTRAKDPKNICLIGKGVVFDTGGYDIKADGAMLGMHRDMTGAAVSLSLFKALVSTKIKANVDLYLAVGENLISEDSYKPNDVVFAMDGTSVEVSNTDAEGRMLLVDTILYSKKLNPDIILNFATLTGAVSYSLDTRYAGSFSNRLELGQLAVKSGVESGERVWNFPMDDDFSDTLESDIADIAQCTDSDNAEHIYAACFLKHFAGNTPWIHIDLGCESNSNGLGLVETDITGFGVRWGHDFITKYLKENLK